jgi:hypothetical protein
MNKLVLLSIPIADGVVASVAINTAAGGRVPVFTIGDTEVSRETFIAALKLSEAGSMFKQVQLKV